MKHLIYLLTISAVLAAAEQPKTPAAPPPPSATLNNTETFSIRTIVTEARNLEEQLKLKREQYELFVADACQRNFQKMSCRMTEDGKIALREIPAPPPPQPPPTAAPAKKEEPKK